MLLFAIFPAAVLAQNGDSVGFSVTPSLMNINLTPGDEFGTKVKVINNTSRPLKIYAEAVDFRDSGTGQIEFLNDPGIKNDLSAANVYLSRWMTLAKEEIELAPFGSEEIPFVISVPKEANPGGHYAAILVGPDSPDEKTDGSVVKISSKIAFLILSRVAGDVQEKGMIREFSVDKKFSGAANINFSVRFQNQGNIHLRPRGTIKVFDMFGKEKGKSVDFNASTDSSGNVLPGGDREWLGLKWQDEQFFLFNRYKAELSLSFGEETKQTDTRYVFFWVIDWKWLTISVISLLIFFVLLLVIVRMYVRQSVKNLQKEMGIAVSGKRVVRKKTVAVKKVAVVDLKKNKK